MERYTSVTIDEVEKPVLTVVFQLTYVTLIDKVIQ